MASTLDHRTFSDLIEKVLDTPAAKRGPVVAKAVEYLHSTSVIEVWAESISNQFSYHDRTGREDIRSVIIEKILITLHAAQRSTTRRVNNWVEFLFGLSKNAVHDYLGSSQVTVASGMSSATRRQNTINLSRRELIRQLGREPSRSEIIEHANSHVKATRSNPQKQGALITEQDFTNSHAAPLDIEETRGVATSADTESRAEAALATRGMRDIAVSMFPEDTDVVLAVLAAWVDLTLESETPSGSAIQRRTGLSQAQVKRGLESVQQVLEAMRATAQQM